MKRRTSKAPALGAALSHMNVEPLGVAATLAHYEHMFIILIDGVPLMHTLTHLPLEMETTESLVLTLDGACLQTAARQAHLALTRALIEEREEGVWVEAALELLRDLLVHTDFASLRAAHPVLLGSPPCRIRLFRDSKGRVAWELKQEA